MTTLCLDFGNSRKKGALFSNEQIFQEFTFENAFNELSKLIAEYKPENCILSSVIADDEKIETFLNSTTNFHKLSPESKLPFTMAVSKKDTVGADRLALLAAGARFYPEKNSLIISLGSCITYNFLNQQNVFLGGSISPGLDMRFRAMHELTAKLPLAKTSFNIPFIGYDTTTNLQSGVMYGIEAELNGIIQKYFEKFGNFNVVLTGGNSAYFAGQLKYRIFADLNFLFKGLYALSEINCRN